MTSTAAGLGAAWHGHTQRGDRRPVPLANYPSANKEPRNIVRGSLSRLVQRGYFVSLLLADGVAPTFDPAGAFPLQPIA